MSYIRFCFTLLLLPFCIAAQTPTKQIGFRALTVENGLSQNSVVSIAQDSIGYMWFATQDGLNQYDGRTFVFYNKQFEDITRPTHSKLGKTYVDRQGVIWLITNSGQLEKYNQTTKEFKNVDRIQDVSTIFQDSQLNYYIGTCGKGLYKIDAETKDTISVFKTSVKASYIYDFQEVDSKVYIATSNLVWCIENNEISTINNNEDYNNFSVFAHNKNHDIYLGSFGRGLFIKSVASSNFEQFKGFSSSKLPDDLIIQDLLIDQHQRLWIATYGKGAYLVDFEMETILEFKANKNNPYALHYNDVLCLYEDSIGTIWFGTDGAGLSYYDEHLSKFNVVTNKQVPNEVSVDMVRAITLNDDNVIWLGTSGKGLTSINNDLKTYKTFTTKNSSLLSNRIMSLLFVEHELWIGHQGHGLQIMNTTGTFKPFPETAHLTIWKFYKDNKNRIWLCTRENGLIQFDKNEGIINHFNIENSSLSSNNIRTIVQGDNEQLWIGTDDKGLYLLEATTKRITKIEAIPDKIKSLYFQDDLLWIGTNAKGLKAFNTKTSVVNTYTKDDGLPNNVIYGILPGHDTNLWLSSNKGLSKFTIVNGEVSIENYGNYNGLQAFEFNTGAYYKGANGMLYFGGLEGVNWFNPNALSFNKTKPKTVISKFEIFNKAHKQVQNKNYKHNQNTMTFTFAGLHFSQPERNQYKYQLVNHDSSWIDSGNNNVAHYTNLPPNDYVFKVISSNYDLVWNTTPETYSFSILKPWYLTNLAKVVYSVLILLSFFVVYKYFKWRWNMKLQLQIEHDENERLKSIDEFKTKLYTNISHEFRTPLTLISGPIENQLTKPELSKKDRLELSLVKQNASRLLNLVNQMSDLSMIDSGQLKLKVSHGNLNILLQQIVAAFKYKANEKQIHINSHIKHLNPVWFDKDVMEKIVSNLLSNAIKYAPVKSDIIIDANRQSDALVLSVINVNKDVSQKDLSKLFQRFYQNSKHSDGVGVGLALVKELVVLSKGIILANNLELNKIQFTVTLPIHKNAFNSQDFLVENNEIIEQVVVPETNAISQGKSILLIVEDDTDIRTFIASYFNESYTVIKAENGQTGIKKAFKHLPDLIISDIMMPIQDGITLCNTLKYNELTSHIPIILLTAKVGDAHEIQGLKTGADAYITKPFHAEKLKLRVNKLIENRKQLKKHYSQNFTINPELAITSTESDFLKRIKDVLDKEVTNSNFTSERFSELMHISRTQLHRKLKAIVGLSTTEFIRTQRLKLAVDLLSKSDATVSEIAYQVGFNSPSYFIKCFKKTYNCTPSNYNI